MHCDNVENMQASTQKQSLFFFFIILNKTHDMEPVNKILKLNIRKQLTIYFFMIFQPKKKSQKNTVKVF